MKPSFSRSACWLAELPRRELLILPCNFAILPRSLIAKLPSVTCLLVERDRFVLSDQFILCRPGLLENTHLRCIVDHKMQCKTCYGVRERSFSSLPAQEWEEEGRLRAAAGRRLKAAAATLHGGARSPYGLHVCVAPSSLQRPQACQTHPGAHAGAPQRSGGKQTSPVGPQPAQQLHSTSRGHSDSFAPRFQAGRSSLRNGERRVPLVGLCRPAQASTHKVAGHRK